MKSGVLKLRKPIPLARSIRWLPAGTNARPDVIEDLALFITQGALREVMRHLRSDPEQELLGFLLGELFECPDTGARYVVINAAVRTGHVIPEVEPVQIPEEEWLGLQLEVRRRRTTLVGWYHSAPFVGPRPARLDMETHCARFTEPWQCGLVVATAGNDPAGGFFRPVEDRASAASAGSGAANGVTVGATVGGELVPFHELLDDDAFLEGGRKRTLVDWTNYATAEPVEYDTSMRGPHRTPAAPRAPDAGRSAGAPAPNPFGAGWSAASIPVMIPSATPPGVDMSAWEMPESAPAPARGRKLVVAGVAIVVLGGVAAGGVTLWNRYNFPEPPAGEMASVPAGRSGARGAAPAVERPAPSLTPESATGATSAGRTGSVASSGNTTSPGSTGVAPVTSPTTQPVAPVESLGLDSIAAAGTSGATTSTRPPGAQPPAGRSPAASSAAAPPAAQPSRSAITGLPAGAPAPPNAQVAQFDSLADSLERAVRNFRNRSSDFSLGRLTCTGLAAGYRSADDAFIALASNYRGVRDQLDDARESRYESLEKAAEEMNEEFDKSKCPRP